MRGDVVLERFHEKRVNDVGFVVRHALVEVFVEGEEMAAGASSCELRREHILATGWGPRSLEHAAR